MPGKKRPPEERLAALQAQSRQKKPGQWRRKPVLGRMKYPKSPGRGISRDPEILIKAARVRHTQNYVKAQIKRQERREIMALKRLAREQFLQTRRQERSERQIWRKRAPWYQPQEVDMGKIGAYLNGVGGLEEFRDKNFDI